MIVRSALIGVCVSGSLFVLAGCGSPAAPAVPSTSGTGSAGSGSSGSSTTTSPAITQPSVYVVSDTTSPTSVLVFPEAATSSTYGTVVIPGTDVSVDDTGNIYVFDRVKSQIAVYSSAAPNGTPVRSLPIGMGTKIAAVVDVVASATGEIYISDGVGIAVFSPTATGNAAPVRYIVGSTQSAGGLSTTITPALIAVDRSDTLYVQIKTDSSIAVFKATDTGTVVPTRVITGPLTRLNGDLHYNLGMATDNLGNLYVSAISPNPDTGKNDFGIFEFSSTANGNVAPTRFVTAPQMYPYSGGDGIAVDAAGTIYMSSGTESGTQTVFEFASTLSGSVAPTNTVTIPAWFSSPNSRIAVH